MGVSKRSAGISEKLLNEAAELRVAGLSWTAVGNQLNRSPETVRRWPQNYPEQWQKAVAMAERQLMTEAIAESVHTLRRQLRSGDDKASREAARHLLQFRRQFGPSDPGPASERPVTGEGRQIAEFLEGLSDAQVDQLLAELASAQSPSAVGVDVTPPSP